MGLLSAFKSKLSGAAQKYSGRTDFLEAVCAASSLVAAADGNIDDNEVGAAIDAVKSNKIISEAFDARTIEATMDKMLGRAKGRVGRNELKKELADIAKDFEMSETVLLTALEVADSGGISADEKKILQDIAGILGLDLSKYE
jgi:tellurite resistance protein